MPPTRLSSAAGDHPSSMSPGHRRRSFASAFSDPSSADLQHESQPASASKIARKVSRACDFCKARKAKCNGEKPCNKCVAKSRACQYNAKYTRGRPPTPPPSATPAAQHDGSATGAADMSQQQSVAPSGRASPELGMAEIQGQVFDPTSGLTFLHRAWKRLSAQDARNQTEQTMSDAVVRPSVENQPVTMAGDRPLPESNDHTPIRLRSPPENRRLLDLYFEFCVATYRILHRPSVEKWLSVVEQNTDVNQPVWYGIGHARAAIVLACLALATCHDEKSKGYFSADDEAHALQRSDELFTVSSLLVDAETGYPKLESAQARLVHVLYLLTTSRFNKSWYVFGSALQIISALGMHRRENAKKRRHGGPRSDYIQSQCRMRTFWTAYVLDNYLGVVFRRPRHFHDEDIDQDFPDRVNDEDMTTSGPSEALECQEDCHIDALSFHAKIARIIGTISREVYTIRDTAHAERASAANRLIQNIQSWFESLPLHLGSIRPSMLIPSYRRQATVLKLAHSHAIMHASRLFLLSNDPSERSHSDNCIAAARTVLETVDRMAKEGPIFHAFWWTHYVTFCALVVVYVWEIQQRKMSKQPAETTGIAGRSRQRLLQLADKCQTHLARATATNSPSRRYAVILEEFRGAATGQATARPDVTGANGLDQLAPRSGDHIVDDGMPSEAEGMWDYEGGMATLDPYLLDEWQTTDWLDLDSSAFWPNLQFDESIVWPEIG
ncbi:putative C6 transcription factor [Emericellopsis atlantica]|uniref:C6 transcription factor n=1 Tax=Emericellopsis atlantica TaxID=2614577 RepID=A0A9P7ZQ26_9HYPO|nr:putative C6 transcription factor [Emericellopsis atlantica]KAG9255757.1 putative C6 transcription factor [Emericellopsis atlantica]